MSGSSSGHFESNHGGANGVPLHRLSALENSTLSNEPIAQDLRTAFDSVKYRTDTPHRHDYYEIYLLTGGGGSCIVENDKSEVDPGSICLLPPGLTHCWSESDEMDGFVARVPTVAASCLPKSSSISPILFSIGPKMKGRLQSLLNWIVEEDTLKFDGSVSQRNLSEQRWKLLLETLSAEVDSASSTLVNTDKQYEICCAFLSLLEQKYHLRWGVQDYATRLGISRSTLLRVTHKVYGSTASQLIQKRSMQEAERLLINTSMTCIEISTSLGFPSQAQFTRTFNRTFKCSPSCYRKKPLN